MSRWTSACSCSRPDGDDGGVKRMFVPRDGLRALRDRPAASASCWSSSSMRTPEQVEQAVGLQEELRSQKLGDILVTRQMRHARAAARGDRAPGQDADGADRRGAAVARHGEPDAAAGSAGAAAARPQRAARRSAGAHGRGLARGPADRAGPQDGLPAGRPRRLPGRARGAAQAELRGGGAAARHAAAGA